MPAEWLHWPTKPLAGEYEGAANTKALRTILPPAARHLLLRGMMKRGAVPFPTRQLRDFACGLFIIQPKYDEADFSQLQVNSYSPRLDIIVTPQRGTFISVESLYAVGFANIFTGRLDRQWRFEQDAYAFETLMVKIGAHDMRLSASEKASYGTPPTWTIG